MISWLLSIDPGTNSAWALWSRATGGTFHLERIGRHRIREAGSYRAPNVLECQSLLVDLSVALRIDWSQAHVVVEGQFFVAHRPGRTSSPWTDVECLIESRMSWQDAALAAGASTSSAAPSKWIKAMTKGFEGKTSKERIEAAVAARFGNIEVEAGGDESDAILLGAWWLEEQGLRATRVAA